MLAATTTGLCGKRYNQIKWPVKSKVEQIISFHTFENDNIPLIRFQVCFNLNFAIKIKSYLREFLNFLISKYSFKSLFLGPFKHLYNSSMRFFGNPIPLNSWCSWTWQNSSNDISAILENKEIVG